MRYTTGAAVVSLAVTLLNPELGEGITGLLGGTWVAFSRWWALVPLGFLVILFIYGLMQANYEAFQKTESEKEALAKQIASDEERAAFKAVLTKAWQEGQLLHDNYASDADADAWERRVSNLIYNALNESEAQVFYSDNQLLPIASSNDTSVRQRIRRRQARIVDLKKRLDRDRLNLKPTFNPENWENRFDLGISD